MTPAVTGQNGHASESIAKALQDEATVGYIPTIPLESLWFGGGDMPQITLRRDMRTLCLLSD
jgi:hypothetical protein